jgi:hypothetical protein
MPCSRTVISARSPSLARGPRIRFDVRIMPPSSSRPVFQLASSFPVPSMSSRRFVIDILLRMRSCWSRRRTPSAFVESSNHSGPIASGSAG